MPLQALIQVLTEQKNVHTRLLDIAAEKKDAIINNNVELLNQLVNKEAKLVKQVAEWEEKRLFEMSRYIVGKGYRPNPNITMSDMLKIVFKAEEKMALQNLQAELLEVIGKLKAANELNQQLIKQSLHFINYSIDLMIGADEDESVYRHPGQQNASNKRPGLFDTRA